MRSFDRQVYQDYLKKKKSELESEIARLKVEVGQAEGAATSWSRPAQKSLEQDLVVASTLHADLSKRAEDFEKSGKEMVESRLIGPGSLITVDMDGEIFRLFLTVGSGDLDFGVLSTESPMGISLLGKKTGEEIKEPSGDKVWKVLRVE